MIKTHYYINLPKEDPILFILKGWHSGGGLRTPSFTIHFDTDNKSKFELLKKMTEYEIKYEDGSWELELRDNVSNNISKGIKVEISEMYSEHFLRKITPPNPRDLICQGVWFDSENQEKIILDIPFIKLRDRFNSEEIFYKPPIFITHSKRNNFHYRFKFSNSKESMYDSEIIAHQYLIEKGYKEEDINYYSANSPDFITSDGIGWEVKHKENIKFSPNQYYMDYNTVLLLVDENGKVTEQMFYEVLFKEFLKNGIGKQYFHLTPISNSVGLGVDSLINLLRDSNLIPLQGFKAFAEPIDKYTLEEKNKMVKLLDSICD